MELFFELTRRCDMQCNHCLRGNAEGKDMSRHTIRTILNKLGGEAYQFGFGGGEAILKPALIEAFTQEVMWSPVNTQYFDPTWIVSNGKRLFKCDGNTYDEEFEERVESESHLIKALRDLARHIPINLAVSIDKWHDENASGRFKHVEGLFEVDNNIEVVSFGPSSSINLISMGRNAGGGQDLNIESDSRLWYVTYDGYIYTSCDLSYNFMDNFRGSALCLGSIHLNTYDEIHDAYHYLQSILKHNGGSVDVGAWDITEFLDVEKEYKQSLIKEAI